jgi:hypothetical protein
MTRQTVIFSEQGGSAPPLKIAIIYRFKIFLLSKQFFRKKNTITEHKKAYSRILGITETGLIMPLLTNPYRGAWGDYLSWLKPKTDQPASLAGNP